MTTHELDRLILRILANLGTDSYEAEMLLRIGATKGFVRVHEAAERLGWHRNRLSESMGKAGLPSPHTLICWGRLLATMADARPRPVHGGPRTITPTLDEVAEKHGWCVRSHITETFVREAGMTTTDWRKAGASLDSLADALVNHWRWTDAEQVA